MAQTSSLTLASIGHQESNVWAMVTGRKREL